MIKIEIYLKKRILWKCMYTQKMMCILVKYV